MSDVLNKDNDNNKSKAIKSYSYSERKKLSAKLMNVKSKDDYIEKAVYYANNIDELEEIRKNLFKEVIETPLFNTKEFSNNFSEALDNMIKIKSADYR